jgi:hypothetical protein
MLSRRAFVPAVLAVLLVGSSAQADEPFVTDPEGDAGRCSGFCLTPTVASDLAVDMLSADIQLHDQTLSFSWKLLDLDRISTGPLSAKADDDVTYMYSFLGDGWLSWGNVDNAGGYGSDYTVG